MISAAKAANIIIDEAVKHRRVITPLQVMKHVYIAHGMFLGRYGEPLITDQVQAWQYGPVIPSLYGRLKRYGSGPITDRVALPPFDRTEPTASERETLRSVYATYGEFSGPALSNLTHRPGSPWSKTWRPGVNKLIIPNDLILRHYRDAIAKNVLESA